jgi:chlorite dismutase
MSTKSEAEIRAERDEAARAPRQFVSFAFFKLNPSFRRALSEAEASDAVAELCGVLEDAGRKFLIYPYTTLGVRADADFLLWRISFQLEDFEQLTAAMLRTRMGKYLDTTSSYLSMTKTSIRSRRATK